MRNPKTKLLIISILIFVASLPMKTYCVENDCGEYWSGLATLLIGFLGILYDKAGYISWFANPLIILAWILPYRLINLKLISSLLASFLVLYFLTFDETIINEAGHIGKITGYASGYWFWTSSIIIYTFGLFYFFLRRIIKNAIDIK